MYQFALTPLPPESMSNALILGQSTPAQGCLWRDGAVVARGLLWWDGGIGRLGQLQAADTEVAVAFLHQACATLRQRGCTFALGPMDGDTWHDYRCALHWQAGPPFWGEPQTDPRWVTWFTEAGFDPVAQYESRLCLDLTRTHAPRRRRHPQASIQIQSAQGEDMEMVLPKIYALVMASFRRQPFFQPLPETTFAQYLQPRLASIDPTLVQLAWAGSRLVGFLLAMPDPLASDHRQMIVKTLAVWPQRTYAGLGYALLEAAHQAGFCQGYRQAIHALMHRQNPSCNLSRRYSQPFRDYVLMGRPLASPLASVEAIKNPAVQSWVRDEMGY